MLSWFRSTPAVGTGRSTEPRPYEREIPPHDRSSSTRTDPDPVDRRLVSGPRVLCGCSFDLSESDPFSLDQPRRDGLAVVNVRGGSFYLPVPPTRQGALELFPPEVPPKLWKLALYTDDGGTAIVGDVGVRFLKLLEDPQPAALVLRFVDLDEAQLDLLNTLPTRFPVVEGAEQEIAAVRQLSQP